jgi:hypothetical protein
MTAGALATALRLEIDMASPAGALTVERIELTR